MAFLPDLFRPKPNAAEEAQEDKAPETEKAPGELPSTAAKAVQEMAGWQLNAAAG
jgi:hypothetical protein